MFRPHINWVWDITEDGCVKVPGVKTDKRAYKDKDQVLPEWYDIKSAWLFDSNPHHTIHLYEQAHRGTQWRLKNY